MANSFILTQPIPTISPAIGSYHYRATTLCHLQLCQKNMFNISLWLEHSYINVNEISNQVLSGSSGSSGSRVSSIMECGEISASQIVSEGTLIGNPTSSIYSTSWDWLRV